MQPQSDLNGIVLDLETQRLFSEVKRVLRYLPDTAGWLSLVDVGERPPAPPQWLVELSPGVSGSPALMAAALADAHATDFIYDPQLQEIDAMRPFCDDWRSMMCRRLRVSVAVTWDTGHFFRTWSESDVPALVDELASFPYIVGVNLASFDLPVLERYAPDVRQRLGYRTVDLLAYAEWGLFLDWLTRRLSQSGLPPSVDGLEALVPQLPVGRKYELWEAEFARRETLRIPGCRLTLNSLAHATLGERKSGKANRAPLLFLQGQLEQLVAYCQQDVQLTMNLFLHGCTNGVVRYKQYQLAVRWPDIIALLETLTSPPSTLVCTETDIRRFQWDLLAPSRFTPLEKALHLIRARKLADLQREYRRERKVQRQLERERLANDPRWRKRQNELATIRRLRKKGHLTAGSDIAREFDVNSSTVSRWARALGLRPLHAGRYYFTLSQARLLRHYGAATPRKRAEIARRSNEKHLGKDPG